jgi:hypothetical protein
MSLATVSRRAAALSALLLLAPAAAAAQERPLFRWTGPVDREVRLVLRGRDLMPRYAGDNERGGDRARVARALPRRDGVVTVSVDRGRGQVDVVQQPSRANDYTTIVRVRDPRAGADDYRLSAYWRPTGDGRLASDGRWDDDDESGWERDDRRDRDERWERDRDRDRERDKWGRVRGDGRWGRTGDVNAAAGALRWRGLVDDVVEIRVRGDRVHEATLSGREVRDARGSVSGRALPARDVDVRLTRVAGRGRVSVVEQPSAQNGYTAVLRIHDQHGGAGWYDLDASW